MTIIIRRMKLEDIEPVMEIEDKVVEFPWTRSILFSCIDVGFSCWVIIDTDIEKTEGLSDIVGYGILSMKEDSRLSLKQPNPSSFRKEWAHILNICIKPGFQRKGLGKSMMEHLISQSKLLKAKLVYLYVRVSNYAAHEFYKKLGFSVVGEIKNYYPVVGGSEDALVLLIAY